jgi:hypothetical protein
MLESLVKYDDDIGILFYRIAYDVGHFPALQLKTKKRETNYNNKVHINICDCLGKNNLSSSSSSSIQIKSNTL